jgi:hypothetical protein
VIVPANALLKSGEGALSFADVKLRVGPHAEWAQMYQEVWRIERSFFYDRNIHGTNAVASQARIENSSPKCKPSGFVRWRAFRMKVRHTLLSQNQCSRFPDVAKNRPATSGTAS